MPRTTLLSISSLRLRPFTIIQRQYEPWVSQWHLCVSLLRAVGLHTPSDRHECCNRGLCLMGAKEGAASLRYCHVVFRLRVLCNRAQRGILFSISPLGHLFPLPGASPNTKTWVNVLRAGRQLSKLNRCRENGLRAHGNPLKGFPVGQGQLARRSEREPGHGVDFACNRLLRPPRLICSRSMRLSHALQPQIINGRFCWNLHPSPANCERHCPRCYRLSVA